MAHRSMPPLFQHTKLYRPPLNFSLSQHTTLYRSNFNFSPLSLHNTLWPTSQFLLSLSKTLYRPPYIFSLFSLHNTLSPNAQFLPSLSTQHSMAHGSNPPHSTKKCVAHCSISPITQHKNWVAHRSITLLFLHTTQFRPPLKFPFSQQTTINRQPLNFSPLSAKNTLSPNAQIFPCLSTQHCKADRTISPLSQHNTVSPTAQILPFLSTQHYMTHRSIPTISQHKTL